MMPTTAQIYSGYCIDPESDTDKDEPAEPHDMYDDGDEAYDRWADMQVEERHA